MKIFIKIMRIKRFEKILSCIRRCICFLENAKYDDFHEEYAKQWYQIYYDYNKRNINRREIRIEKLRKSFSYHFLKYILQTEENNSMEEIQSKISKYIVNDTMGEYNANVTLYYKNILEPQQYETFEKW